MTKVRNLSVRQQRSRRGPSYVPPLAPADEGPDFGVSASKQDAAFRDAMTKAMAFGREKMPPAEPPREPTVIRRVHVPGFVHSASNLEN